MSGNPDRGVTLESLHKLTHGEVDIPFALTGDDVPNESHRQKLIPAGMAHQGGKRPPQVMSQVIHAGSRQEAANELRHAIFTKRLSATLADSGASQDRLLIRQSIRGER